MHHVLTSSFPPDGEILESFDELKSGLSEGHNEVTCSKMRTP